jgi:hypothetical protein
MNRKKRSRSIPPSKEGIERLKAAKNKGEEGKPLTYERIAEKANVSVKTIKRFFNGEGIEPWYARQIIESLGLEEEQVLSLEESLVEKSIERIESSSVILEGHEKRSERASELIAELERKLKTKKDSTDDSHQAMDWLKANRKALAQDATKEALRKHDNQAKPSEGTKYPEKFEQLSRDIRKYLQLLYYWLDEGAWELIDQAIKEQLIPLNLEKRLYVEALIFIKEERVAKELPSKVAKELTLCLDYLITIIPIRF